VATFGKIQSAGDPRILQLAAKFVFRKNMRQSGKMSTAELHFGSACAALLFRETLDRGRATG
jgi:hypothetical protein